MKSFAILTVSLLLVAGAVGAGNAKKPSWKISGQLEESCSCAAACPCWFDSKPTMASCSGNQVLFIKHGRYGKVSLDGLAIANFVESPENQTMMQSFGKWKYSYLYIDEKANAEQRAALEEIGKTVMPFAGSKNTKLRFAPIARQTVGDEHRITVGKYGSFRGKLLTGGLGGTPKLQNPPGADPIHAEYQQGRASNVTYHDAGQNWTLKGTNYMLADFSVTSAQYEKYHAGLAQKMGSMKASPKKG
jgi:hypothetical protein